MLVEGALACGLDFLPADGGFLLCLLQLETLENPSASGLSSASLFLGVLLRGQSLKNAHGHDTYDIEREHAHSRWAGSTQNHHETNLPHPEELC